MIAYRVFNLAAPSPKNMAMFLLAVLASAVLGVQPPADTPPDARARGAGFFVSWGFGGQVPSGVWSPIRVNVGTGDGALSGVVVVRYQQDATQSAEIVTPFAATPNKVTPVSVVVRLPEMCESVSVALLNEGGSVVASERYEANTSQAGKRLPSLLTPEMGLVVSVGRNGLADAVRDWSQAVWQSDAERPRRQAAPSAGAKQSSRSTDPGRSPFALEARWRLMTGARVEPALMPMSWTAYDGVVVLAVDGDAEADPIAVSAVRRWVESGGRLVLLAGDAGDAWRRWLPPEAVGAVSAGALRRVDTPKALREAMDRARAMERKRAEDASDATAAAEIPATSETISARSLRLAGSPRGWVLRWSVGEGDGLLAEGPCGFGWVTVLGVDPARVPATLSTRAAGSVWRSALEAAVDDFLMSPPQQRQMWWYAATRGRVAATNSALESLADIPMLGNAVFFAIGGCMLGLALVLGPGDYVVLRRLGARHRSWATALGWIAVATCGAYVMPRVIRTEATRVNGITLIDAIASGVGGVAGPAFHTSFSGIYAARSGVARVFDPVPTDWTSGVAAQSVFGAEGTPTALVPTLQAAAGGEAGSERGNPATTLPLGLWTFRTLLHEGPDALRLVGRVDRSESAYEVTLSGLPRGARVVSAALRVGGSWMHIPMPGEAAEAPAEGPRTMRTPMRARVDETRDWKPRAAVGAHESDGVVWTGRFATDLASANPPPFWAPVPEMSEDEAMTWPPAVTAGAPGRWLDAPGADRRSMAIERRVESRSHAAVYLLVEDWPPRTRINWNARERQWAVVRALIPLETE